MPSSYPRPLDRRRLFLLLSAWPLLWGCGETGSELTVRAPPVELDLLPEAISLHPHLVGGGRIIRTVGCEERCDLPELGMDEAVPAIRVGCMQGRCNPLPTEVCLDMGSDEGMQLRVLDFDAEEPEIDTFFGEITAVEIQRLRYQVVSNTLTVPLPELTLFFGSRQAVRATEPGIKRLGSVPLILAGVTTEMRPVEVPEAGQAALSEHMREVGRAIRLFACTTLDLEPGDAYPEGSLKLRMELSVKLKGSPPR
jgi:hypothetical protein